MLSSSLNIALALMYPVVSLAAPTVFFILRPQEIRSLPGLPLRLTTEEEQASAVRLGVLLPLTSYCLLFSCMMVWLSLTHYDLYQAGFREGNSISGTLRGGYVGMAWAGIWLWMWLVLSAPQRLRREVPGLGAPFTKQVFVWLAGAFSEELWRVVCIAALMTSGYSAAFSITITSAMFAIAFLPGGLERSVLAALEGVIFGLLFVWQRSFLAPFTAHLAVQAVYLWGVGQFSLRRQGKSWRPGIRCPLCGTQLSRLQVKMTEAFRCPSCREQISVSEGYRTAMRLAAIFAYVSLYVATLALFYKQIPERVTLWLAWPVSWGVGTSGLLLYQRVFPPKLQYGEPHFLTLNLEDRRPPNSSDLEDRQK